MSLHGLKVMTTGVEGIGAELLEETAEDALSPVARAAMKLEERMKQKLSVRGRSRPGDPPGLREGALRDAIGRTGPWRDADVVNAAVGVGAGDDAKRRIDDWKGRGVNIYEYARLLEEGGFAGPSGAARIAPRPYIRTSFEELRNEIVADWEIAL